MVGIFSPGIVRVDTVAAAIIAQFGREESSCPDTGVAAAGWNCGIKIVTASRDAGSGSTEIGVSPFKELFL